MNLDMTNEKVDLNALVKPQSYADYVSMLHALFAAGKTTGTNHNEDMLNYAKMNLQRMKRQDKTLSLSPEISKRLANLSQKQTWVVITEGWCGDAAQNLPAIAKMAEASDLIELQLVLRDENLDLMDQFLTNGGRSIPKLIALNSESHEVLGTWGPRPQIAQQMMHDFKKQENGDYAEFQKEIQLWYAKDKSQSLQTEFVSLLENWDLNHNKAG